MPVRGAFEEALPILELLTLRARVATFEQVLAFAQLYRMESNAERLIAMLCRSGLLVSQRLTIRCPQLLEPLVAWAGNDTPDYVTLATRLSSRAEEAPPRLASLYWATKLAEPLTGGLSGQNRQPLQVQHDLGVTAALLRSLERPEFFPQDWFSEDIVHRDFAWFCPSKRPDALVLDDDGRPIRIIEIGGVYSAADLRRMHRFYSKERIQYELW